MQSSPVLDSEYWAQSWSHRWH